MLKFENLEVVGMEAAIRGMRNPMNSWDKSDSYYGKDLQLSEELLNQYHIEQVPEEKYIVGPTDLQTMKNLSNGGPVHGKFKRMIKVYMDITAPLYWWKEFDTYKVGTNCDSCSTMHKIHAKEFVLDDFSHEHLLTKEQSEPFNALLLSGTSKSIVGVELLHLTINVLNFYRQRFLESKDKQYWWQMIQLLPTSYNQRRTVELNYEVLTAMYRDRRNHKLDEWRTLCERVEELPYSELITAKPTYV